jgi:hypothetical protein
MELMPIFIPVLTIGLTPSEEAEEGLWVPGRDRGAGAPWERVARLQTRILPVY